MPRKKIPLDPNLPFHTTSRVHNKSPFPLPLEQMWSIFENRLYYLKHVYGFEVLSFVMMANHYHGIFRDPFLRRAEGMANFQRETAKEVNGRANCLNQLWGRPYFCSLLTSTHYYLNCYKYVYQNPVRVGLSKNVEDYRFSTLNGLLGQSPLLIPVSEDDTLFSDPEDTLSWLNQKPEFEDVKAMKHALQHRIFSFPKDPKTKKPHRLESHLL